MKVVYVSHGRYPGEWSLRTAACYPGNGGDRCVELISECEVAKN